MPLKELLLKSSSFNAVLDRFNVKPGDFTIKDEPLLLERIKSKAEDSLRESVLIEAINASGRINLLGTIYCNLSKGLAVFELDVAEPAEKGAAFV
ncbi:hypothetical protein [Arcticibacter sp. MXS-1]|uniref:hypothetical protein n=1 Tax=Arcticibacter sp. MXS-1 TaxID=3341726 RepID=UPI0035A8E94E